MVSRSHFAPQGLSDLNCLDTLLLFGKGLLLASNGSQGQGGCETPRHAQGSIPLPPQNKVMQLKMPAALKLENAALGRPLPSPGLFQAS